MQHGDRSGHVYSVHACMHRKSYSTTSQAGNVKARERPIHSCLLTSAELTASSSKAELPLVHYLSTDENQCRPQEIQDSSALAVTCFGALVLPLLELKIAGQGSRVQAPSGGNDFSSSHLSSPYLPIPTILPFLTTVLSSNGVLDSDDNFLARHQSS